jgi:hypothetical protein
MVNRRQEALRRLATYAPEQVRVFAVPEPDNAFDSRAVKIMAGVQYGAGLFCLGYLPKEYAPAAASLKVAGLRVLTGDINGARVALKV